MDEDLVNLDRDMLVVEVKRLRAGIRKHRDSSGHELCWHHPQLWGLLPEKSDPLPSVPAWPQFLRGCLKYRESLDQRLRNAPRTTGEFEQPQNGDTLTDDQAMALGLEAQRWAREGRIKSK